MQKWCLVNTMRLQLGELLRADSEMPTAEQGTGTLGPPCRLPQPALPSAPASAGTRARPLLLCPTPQGPPSICISHPLAHVSASNSPDYPADSSALLCPWTVARGRGWQGRQRCSRGMPGKAVAAAPAAPGDQQGGHSPSTAFFPLPPHGHTLPGMVPRCVRSKEEAGRRECWSPCKGRG